jgi:hypothetical protein
MVVVNESKNIEMTTKLIELQQKILDIQGDFGEMQQKLFEARQENRELKEKQRGLDDDGVFRESLKYDERIGVWTRNVDGVTEAYCGDCLNDGRRTRLKRVEGGTYVCQNHGYRNSR